MAIKKIDTRSSGKRQTIMIDYKKVLTTDSPEKNLTRAMHGKGGRNNQGKITVRHQGSGVKRRYRIIDFKRNKDNKIGFIKTVEYDPNRTSFISLVVYEDGEKRYIIAPKNISVGDKIISGTENIDIIIGNAMPLEIIPEGTLVHNIEIYPGQIGRAHV